MRGALGGQGLPGTGVSWGVEALRRGKVPFRSGLLGIISDDGAKTPVSAQVAGARRCMSCLRALPAREAAFSFV